MAEQLIKNTAVALSIFDTCTFIFVTQSYKSHSKTNPTKQIILEHKLEIDNDIVPTPINTKQ